MSENKRKIECGDFQTPLPLAEMVCALLHGSGLRPAAIIEPTCGEGAFLEAAAATFGDGPEYFGLEINPAYAACAAERMKSRFPNVQAAVYTADFFAFDWDGFLRERPAPILFLGNPPWVTSAVLEALGAANLPQKSNLKNLSGLSAKTGKANFDISEWMLLRLAELARNRPFSIAMLCKTGVARKALEQFWKRGDSLCESALYRINALQWFGAAVDACLFIAHFRPGATGDKTTALYDSLDAVTPITRFGLASGEMVSDVEAFRELSRLTGTRRYRWRSGVKHDLAKVMEFTVTPNGLQNGFGDFADIEETYVYPLMKATEVSKGVSVPTRRVLITQKTVGEDTAVLQTQAPKTWRYLEQYKTLFRERKSSIYRGQPDYCLFGVGPYTFTPYKIAISGLHKEFRFTFVPPFNGKPVCFDDTCYLIGSDDKEEAGLLAELFNDELPRRFLSALVFTDGKRPITADALNRIDIKRVAEELGKAAQLAPFLASGTVEAKGQGVLLFETKGKYTDKSNARRH